MESAYNDKWAKIQSASQVETEHLIPNLMRLLGYRQRIAQDMRKRTEGTSEFNEIERAYDYINEDIKKLLSI
jgi:hypothetical protein